MHISSEVINEETVESSQLTEKEVDPFKGEDTEGISQESVEERTVMDIQDDNEKEDRKSTRLNSSHSGEARMPSSA